MNPPNKPLIHKYEELLFVFCLITSITIVLSLMISVIGAIILAVLGLLTWFSHAMSMAHIQVNGVRLRETQFPSLYEKTKNLTEKMGLKKMPEVYIVESGGILNAFATRVFALFGKNFVVLYSDFAELAEESHDDEVEYVLAHELAHIKRNHVGKNFYVFPAMWVPFLGEAYSRACEYTCDRMAVHYTQKPESAIRALLVFAAGKRMFQKVNVADYLEQYNEKKGFLVTLMELLSTHPPLPKRISAIEQFAGLPETAVLGKATKYIVTLAVGAGILLPAALTGIGIYGFEKISGLLNDDTPLNTAVYDADVEEVNRLLEEGADPNEQNDNGESPLDQAIFNEDAEMVSLLIENGADPNKKDDYGWIPLMTAVDYELMDISELLLEAGADPNHEDEEGQSAFSLAKQLENQELTELLKKYE
ncbi:hypothetical protein CEF21_04210 [Bacillus sp. FJAT-42376]|uniref:M48 family metallopeptidase n=1 Tax=Bacillus sp. FJAT-42376 TaxID=2014076 RepID=UPI000F4D934C|nr:M48 family metallopeptidase [Bacillus sp. FJAT-42376]AZB41565.1 hypothetical protein CEF21_04210 [Bacillus sp. FJAT-42376]